MTYSNDFSDCKIIINHENGGLIAETTILEYDKDLAQLGVSNYLYPFAVNQKLSVIIFCDGGVYTFRGNVRRCSGGMALIALYKGNVKKDRQRERYAVKAPARIDMVVSEDDIKPLEHPYNVTVLNISTSGALVRADIDAFELNTAVQLNLKINGEATPILSTVVRKTPIDNNTADYGCQFISIEKDGKWTV